MMTERKNAIVRRKHWLQRSENIRKLWWLFAGILALTVLAQFTVDVHGHFGVDGLFGFSALYGFGTCVVMVVVAKILGWWLKRDDSYYPDEIPLLWTAPMARGADWKSEEEMDEGEMKEEGSDD
jgi:hypothetical protein